MARALPFFVNGGEVRLANYIISRAGRPVVILETQDRDQAGQQQGFLALPKNPLLSQLVNIADGGYDLCEARALFLPLRINHIAVGSQPLLKDDILG